MDNQVKCILLVGVIFFAIQQETLRLSSSLELLESRGIIQCLTRDPEGSEMEKVGVNLNACRYMIRSDTVMNVNSWQPILLACG